jgi:hypothetical protein
MSNKSIAPLATMGIDIGKNSFHVVGLGSTRRNRAATKVVTRASRSAARRNAAMPDRHGGLCRQR